MTDNQLNPKVLRAATWWIFGCAIGAAAFFLLGGGYIMFASAIAVGMMAGRYRRRIQSRIPPAAQLDVLNILASWIVSIALITFLFGWGDRLSASHFLTIPAATGMIAMFYYVAMGGRVDVFRIKILPRG